MEAVEGILWLGLAVSEPRKHPFAGRNSVWDYRGLVWSLWQNTSLHVSLLC